VMLVAYAAGASGSMAIGRKSAYSGIGIAEKWRKMKRRSVIRKAKSGIEIAYHRSEKRSNINMAAMAWKAWP